MSLTNPVEKGSLQHFFNEIPKIYFDKFMTGQGIEFDLSFLMRGAPTSELQIQEKIAEVDQIATVSFFPVILKPSRS